MQQVTNKSDQRADLVAVLVVFTVLVIATWLSWGFSPKARLAPFFIAASCTVFLLIDLVPRLLGRSRAATDDEGDPVAAAVGVTPAVHGEFAPPAKAPMHSSVNAILTMLAPFVGLVFLIGILPASLVFIFGYIRLVAKSTYLSAAIYAVLTFLVLRMLFVGLLGIFMYRGVFGLYIPFISG
jgi:hypothetical protein